MLEQILIISLFCVGIYLTGEEGMIAAGVKERLRRLFVYSDDETRVEDLGGGSTELSSFPVERERKVWMAIWGCVVCMGSLWGTLGFVIWNLGSEITWYLLGQWLLTIVGVAVMNGLIWGLYKLIWKANE